MARPPVIISNGGAIGVLTVGLQSTTKKTVEDQLKANFATLNDKSVVMIIKNKGHNPNTHCLYWRLTDDDPYEQGQNVEGVSINDVVDET